MYIHRHRHRHRHTYTYTLRELNMAMKKSPFESDFHLKPPWIGFLFIATFDCRGVYIYIYVIHGGSSCLAVSPLPK